MLGEVSHLHAAILPIRTIQSVTDIIPQPGLGAADGELFTVFGLIHAVIGESAPKDSLGPARHRTIGKIITDVRRGRKQRNRGVQVRNINQLPLAGLLSGKQGKHDAERAVHGGSGIVGNNIQRNGGRPFGWSNQVQHPAQREIIQVVSREITVRTVLAVAAQRAVDDAGVDGPQGLIVTAQPLHHTGPEAFDQHVVLFG